MQEGDCAAEEEIGVPEVRLWHFDAPELYEVEYEVLKNGKAADCYRTRIGFREFRTKGDRFLLNGEPVRLAGMEWMPGSDPRIGNAEREKDIAYYLELLKRSNCVFTRVHWQQDDFFYDWCDRHGMLVQEEASPFFSTA